MAMRASGVLSSALWGIKAFYAFPYGKFPICSPEIDKNGYKIKVLNENFVDLRKFPLARGYKEAEDTPILTTTSFTTS